MSTSTFHTWDGSIRILHKQKKQEPVSWISKLARKEKSENPISGKESWQLFWEGNNTMQGLLRNLQESKWELTHWCVAIRLQRMDYLYENWHNETLHIHAFVLCFKETLVLICLHFFKVVIVVCFRIGQENDIKEQKMTRQTTWSLIY